MTCLWKKNKLGFSESGTFPSIRHHFFGRKMSQVLTIGWTSGWIALMIKGWNFWFLLLNLKEHKRFISYKSKPCLWLIMLRNALWRKREYGMLNSSSVLLISSLTRHKVPSCWKMKVPQVKPPQPWTDSSEQVLVFSYIARTHMLLVNVYSMYK
jgi:hypothetical protein